MQSVLQEFSHYQEHETLRASVASGLNCGDSVRCGEPVFGYFDLRVDCMKLLSFLLLSVSAIAASAGQILFKLGASGRLQLIDFFNLQVFAGLCLYGISTVLWIYVLSFEKLTSVFAFTALTFVLVYCGGVLFLGEHVNMAAIVGVLMVLGGLYLIAVHGVA